MRMYLPTHVDLPPLVQNWFRRITAYTTLLGDTCTDIHGFPSLDDMLEKQEIIERWIEEPPTIDRTLSRRIAFSSLDDAKKGIARDTLRRQEEIRTSALYLREHGLPWTWEGGKVRPVVTEGEMITASYHLEYPTLSLLRKRRIPGSLKKLPETQFPYRSLHHVEVELCAHRIRREPTGSAHDDHEQTA